MKATLKATKGAEELLLMGSSEVPPPRVFLRKSVDLLDYKGVEFFEGVKELAMV